MFAMTVDPWILAFSFVTVAATVFMGFWSAMKSKTASDFFVAGRSVSVGWNASAISGEYLSAASFMGIAGMVMSSGYDALWYPVCYACGYLFLLLFIAGPLRRFGAYTIPDFAEGRFNSPLFRKIAVCFVLFIGFFYTMPQMKGAGTTLAYIFPGLPYWAGVVLVGAVITLNVALGGMKGITLVQSFQYWAKMFAISVPIFVLMAVYGHYGKQLQSTATRTQGGMGLQLQLEYSPPRITVTNENAVQILNSITEKILGKTAMAIGIGATQTWWPDKSFYSESTITGSVFPLPTPTEAEILRTVKPMSEALNQIYLPKQLVGYLESKTEVVCVPAAIFPEAKLAFEKSGLRGLTDQPLSGDEVGTPIVLRKPLPEKAPADSTWLSPFGPLTTKAANAAAANLVRPDWSKRDLLNEPNPVSRQKADWILRLERMVKGSKDSVKPTDRVTYGTGETGKPLSEICIVIQSWAELAHVRCETNLLTKSIVFNSDKIQSPNELVASLEDSLGKQGVTLIHASPKEWWAVSTATAKSWLNPLDTRPYSLLYTYSLIIALVCGTAGLPHILVRFYTNPDGVAAKRTTMWVMILIGIFYVFPPVFGVMGRNLFPELYSGIGAKGTDKIVLELPRLLNEKYAPLGSILSGITCAGAFAAFMSTFSGLLVSMTGAMAHDVYGRMLRPKSTPDQRMKMFKVFAVVIGAVAMLLGSFVEALEINFMVGQAFAIAAASYFPLLFMAVWWRKLTMRGAATGMLTGGLSAVVAISLTSFSTLAAAPGKAGEMFALFKPLNDFWAHHPLLRILCEQPAIWAVPLAIGLMIVVSKLTQREVPADIRMKMLVLHAPEKLGLKQEYIQEHLHGH
jgi:Na+(H+)/acetate symporter ActP